MISIAVQAGGRSSRMGRDKALMPLAGKRLIDHVLERVQPYSEDLFITTHHPDEFRDLGLRLVQDPVPGRGAVYGLQTALMAAHHDLLLVVACDMPLLKPALIEYLLSLAGKADVIIPEMDGKYEPLLAVYRVRACLPALERSLEGEQPRLISFFPLVEVLPVEAEVIDRLDPGRLSFFNVNTPQDARRAEALLLERG